MSTDEASTARPQRSCRTRKHTARRSALEKIRRAKTEGIRVEHESPNEIEDVYRLVDEREYAEIVTDRRDDDWIVDDDGTGYADDGREIFDDDEEQPIQAAKKAKGSDQTKKKNVKRPGSGSIRSLLLAGPRKKAKEENVSVANDSVLMDVLHDLEQTSTPLTLKKGKKLRKSAGLKMSTPMRPSESRNPLGRRSFMSDVTSYREPAFGELKSQSAYEQRHEEGESKRATVQEANDTGKSYATETRAKSSGTAAEDISGIEWDDDFGGFDDASADAAMTVAADERAKETETRSSLSQIEVETFKSVGWETVKDGEIDSDPAKMYDTSNVDTSSLPLVEVDGEEVLRFYWLDAYEEPKAPGTVYLFGKVWIDAAKVYVSCCVAVQNIQRQIYFLMKEKSSDSSGSDDITIMDVYKEFDEKVSSRFKIMKFKSKPVEKNYCFDVSGIPARAEYLEVKYPSNYPALPSDLKGSTFSHVFGTNTSSLETFLLNQKLKGPSWLDIRLPTPVLGGRQVSWCKIEVTIEKPELIRVVKDPPSPPPLVVMSVSVKTLHNAKTHANEILCIGALIHSEVQLDRGAPRPFSQAHLACVTKLSDKVLPFGFADYCKKQGSQLKVELTSSERSMLAFFLAKVNKIDPDVLVGHDTYGFELDVLLHRFFANKVPHWSRIGRLRRSVMPRLGGGPGARSSGIAGRMAIAGRLLCDVKISSKELIRCRSYDLKELSSQILTYKRASYDNDDMVRMVTNGPQLWTLISHTVNDAALSLRIVFELNALPLALQITNICGNTMARTLLGGRSERNEYLLLHAFNEKGYLCPDKEFSSSKPAEEEDDEQGKVASKKRKGTKGKKKPKYAGGLVLEPKRGFYDKFILLLDFNSLYPSIIQEYNICFTTVDRASRRQPQDDEEDEDVIVELPDSSLEPGILPTQIRMLVQRRREVKKLLKTEPKDSEAYVRYDIRQKALKLTANSMYGCLGFANSRFYAKPLAALVTAKGREILLKTKSLAQSLNLEVIYGDTDSIMINTNCTDLSQVHQIGHRVQQEVNKLYKQVELGIDGVFKCMLLLKKKKYAALMLQENRDGSVKEVAEMKGLDIVRRDWCGLAQGMGRYAIEEILSGKLREVLVDNIHTRLQELRDEVENGRVPTDKFVITKSLSKNPDDYPDKKSLPHVQVALRLRAKGQHFRSGDTVPYVICEDGTTMAATQRGYHCDELKKSSHLKIDYKWYLQHQVHPVVSRLCEPIAGTDQALIADCLGLDPTSYRHADVQDDDGEGETFHISKDEKFQDCDRLFIKCRRCGEETRCEGLVRKTDVGLYENGLSCSACGEPHQTVYLQNQLTVIIRKHIHEYYQGVMLCQDDVPEEKRETRRVSLLMQRNWKPKYSDNRLYLQLRYYQHLFDHQATRNETEGEDRSLVYPILTKNTEDAEALHGLVSRHLERNGYSEVDLSTLFKNLQAS